MPFTANRQFKTRPRLLASASGMYYRDVDGNEVLDATAGLWCCNAGHSRPRIVEAIRQQIGTRRHQPAGAFAEPVAVEGDQPRILQRRRLQDLGHQALSDSGAIIRGRASPAPC